MGLVGGGTVADLVQGHILISFTFEPSGTKKTLDEIFRTRNITNPYMRSLCKQEADRMVAQRLLFYNKGDSLVFSKDKQERYSWERAGYKDRVMNFINRLY